MDWNSKSIKTMKVHKNSGYKFNALPYTWNMTQSED